MEQVLKQFSFADLDFSVRVTSNWDMAIIQEVRRDYFWDMLFGIDPPFPLRRIIDIGAHIGAWSCYFAAMSETEPDRPQPQIVAVEPHIENYQILTINTARFPNIHPVPAAVYYKPINHQLLLKQATVNTGGHTVHDFKVMNGSPPGIWQTTEALTIQQIMHYQNWDDVDLIKLDCEGSEYNILKNAPLKQIKAVMGEWHGSLEKFNDEIGNRLRHFKFDIHTKPHHQPGIENLGMFFAVKDAVK